MNVRLSVCCIAIACMTAVSFVAPAASVHREEFVGGANGWTNSAGSAAVVRYTNDLVRVTFTVGPMPNPLPLLLLAGTNASGGAFSGDFHAAGISLLGFTIRAMKLTSDAPTLQWASGTSVFIRAFSSPIAQTGVWYNYSTSLKDVSDAEWAQEAQPFLDRDHFDTCLTNVTEVRIVLNNPSAQSSSIFEIDAIYTDQVPAAEAVRLSGSDVEIVWSPLQTDLVYAVEAVASVAGAWAPIASLTPTGRTYTSSIPLSTNSEPQFYRLKN